MALKRKAVEIIATFLDVKQKLSIIGYIIFIWWALFEAISSKKMKQCEETFCSLNFSQVFYQKSKIFKTKISYDVFYASTFQTAKPKQNLHYTRAKIQSKEETMQ